MRWRNYIWDFDGTLFDSYPHLLECCMKVLAEEGLSFPREDVGRHLQVSFGDMLAYTGLSDEAYRRFKEYELRIADAELDPPVIPFDDAEAVLRAVVQGGGRNYLYTHRNRTALWYCEKFGLLPYFADRVTSEEGFPSKPAPDAILALIRRNGLDPAECVMIGDREIDGLSGRNAGVTGALVNYPPALPDGRSPAEVTSMEICAPSLTEFASLAGIL